MMKNVLITIPVLALFFLVGCSSTSSMLAINNISSPVMVGPIANIKGEKHSKQGKPTPFKVSATSSKTITTSNNGIYETTTTRVQREGTDRFDNELKNAGADTPNSKVVVDKIKLGGSMFLYMAVSEKSWTGMKGEVYK